MKTIEILKALKELAPEAKDKGEFSLALIKKIQEDEDCMQKMQKFIKSKKYGVSTTYFEDYKEKVIFHCYKCGTEDFASSSTISKCPHCGNKIFTKPKYYCAWTTHQEVFFHVEKMDVDKEFAIVYLIVTQYSFEAPNVDFSDPFKALRNAEWNVEIKAVNPFLFDFKTGLKKLSSTTNSVVKETGHINPCVQILKNSNFELFKDKLKEYVFFKDEDIIDALNNLDRDISKKKTTSKLSLKKKELEEKFDKMSFVTPTPLLEENLKKHARPILVKKSYDATNKKTFYTIVCPNCKTIETVSFADNTHSSHDKIGEYTCPHCGKEFKGDERLKLFYANVPYKGTCNSSSGVVSTFWEIKDDILVCRKFISRLFFELPSNDVTVSHKELSRTFMYGKKIFYYTSGDGKVFERTSLSELGYQSDSSFYRAESWVCINSDEELKEIIQKSQLRYSGVLEAWGLGFNKDLKFENPGDFYRGSYIHIWQKTPCIEYLLKSGLKTITSTICKYPKDASKLANPKGNGILEILGMTRPELHIAQDVDASFNDISSIKKIWAIDKTIDTQTYKDIRENSLTSSIIKIKTEIGISVQKQLEYINHAAAFQCINKSATASLWADYLAMAKEVGYNLKNKEKKYPDSLKKEHDIVENVFYTMKNSYDKKAFEEKAKENSKFNYSLKELGLFARVPTTPQEVINEGIDLHHCVGHYVNPIINGSAIVSFIRKYSDPETSYYTVEISSDGVINKILQVKGDMNLDFDSKTEEGAILQKFLEKWAKARKLLIELSE